MLTSGIDFINFNVKKHLLFVKENLISIIKSKNEIVNSLSQNYKNSFSKKILSKYKKVANYRIIGMGGSTHGTQAIYDFLKHKIKNNFVFVDNLQVDSIKEKKKFINLIVSKSGSFCTAEVRLYPSISGISISEIIKAICCLTSIPSLSKPTDTLSFN